MIEGWMLSGDILARAPLSCRYAIVETSEGSFEIWDFDKIWDGKPVVPWRGDNPDALIMKAMALYDRK